MTRTATHQADLAAGFATWAKRFCRDTIIAAMIGAAVLAAAGLLFGPEAIIVLAFLGVLAGPIVMVLVRFVRWSFS